MTITTPPAFPLRVLYGFQSANDFPITVAGIRLPEKQSVAACGYEVSIDIRRAVDKPWLTVANIVLDITLLLGTQ